VARAGEAVALQVAHGDLTLARREERRDTGGPAEPTQC
jgi:hypothetical protein